MSPSHKGAAARAHELSMTMPAIPPRLITISIFGFNGNPEMNDSTTDTTIDIVKAHA